MSAPAGYHSVHVYLYVKDSAAAITWYTSALGAAEKFRLNMPDGSVCHAEVQVGDTVVMLSDENPAWGTTAPPTLGGVTAGLMLYVADVDAAFASAVAAGAAAVSPPADMFWGDRVATVTDPFGHKWTLTKQVKVLTPAEIEVGMAEWLKSMPQG